MEADGAPSLKKQKKQQRNHENAKGLVNERSIIKTMLCENLKVENAVAISI